MDIQAVRIRDLIVLEDHGVTLDDLAQLEGAGKAPTARQLAAIAYLAAVADDPDVDWETATSTTLGSLEGLASTIGDVDPN